MELVFCDELDKLTPEMWRLMEQAAEAAFESEFKEELASGGIDISEAEAEIGVTVVSEEEILELNREYREKDRVTDVLSFPQFADREELLEALIENSAGDEEREAYADDEEQILDDGGEEREAGDDGFGEAEETGEAFPEMPSQILIGDVVICWDQAVRQAKEYGTGLTREVLYLFVHSVMHLFGYDHMEEDEKAVMRAREEEVLSAIGITK